ncbi:MAG: peptide chain release factor 2 [Anaerolineales bacterium]|nr:peptide chain release factor 2 [Anaerolineales bacterium]
MKKKSNPYWSIFDLAEEKKELTEFTKESERSDLWDDPVTAQSLMKKISDLRQHIETWESLQQRIADAKELAEMGDEDLREELEPEINAIERELIRRELTTLLAGPYDKGNAILSINAGAGGTDSQDWASMLQRMYLRWIERQGYKGEILELTSGEEAGVKSITIAIEGKYCYGYLRSEKGVHRLVRLSPFDSNHRRHTSFAQVEVLPQVADDSELIINPVDLKIETFRAGGAGGQNVQKNDTAVRITHIPSGIVASCQNERSQTQNRENALKVLRGRILEIQERERQKEMAELKGAFQKNEWGSQIRSYVLHPYQMVKDHRTSFENGNTQAVLDGDLEGFIESYLRSQLNT